MALRNISDLRGLFSSEMSGASDEDLITRYAASYGIDPVTVANRLNYDPGSGSLTNERLSGAADRYQSNMYGLGEAVTGALGLTGAQEWMKSGRQDNALQSDVAASRAKALGGIDSYKDVHGFGDTANFIGGVAATSFPYLLENAAWAVGDVVTGGALTPAHATRLAAMAPRWLGGEALRAGASVAEHEAAMQAAKGTARGVIGATVPSYASAVGDILGNQREQLHDNGLDDSKTDLLSAAVGGVGYVGAQAFSPLNRMAAGNLPRRAVGALDDMTDFAGGAARLGLNTAITAGKEGAEETFQEFMNQRFGRMAVDPNEEFLSDGAVDRYKESFIGGAALGGVTGGAAGGWRRSGQYKAPEIEAGKPADMLTTPQGFEAGEPADMLTTSQGFEGLTRPDVPPAVNPLGDLTPDWSTTLGVNTEPRVPGIDGAELYRPFDEAPPTTGRYSAAEGLQMPVVPGRPGQADSMAVGLPGEVGLTDADAAAMQEPGAIEARRRYLELHPAVQDAVQQQQAQEAQAEQAKAAEEAQQAALRHTLSLYGEPVTTQIGTDQKMHRWLDNPHYTPESARGAIAKQAQADAKRVAELKAAPGLAEQAELAYAAAYRVKEQQRAANITAPEDDKDRAQPVTPKVFKNRDFTKLVESAQTVGQITDRVRMELMGEQAKAEKADANKVTLLQEFYKGLTGETFDGIVAEKQQTPTAQPVTGQGAGAPQPTQPGASTPNTPAAPVVTAPAATSAVAPKQGSSEVTTQPQGGSVAVAGPETPAERVSRVATELVAKLGLDPNKTVMIGREGRKKPFNAHSFASKLLTNWQDLPTERERRAGKIDMVTVLAVTGRDAEGDLVANPLTLDQIAILRSRMEGGTPVSRAAVHNTLAKFGIDEDMANMMVMGDVGPDINEAELLGNVEVGDAAGYRIGRSLTDVTSNALLSNSDTEAQKTIGAEAGKLTQEDKLALDNAAVDEYLAPPKQEAIEVESNRRLTAERTKAEPAPRLSMVEGEMGASEADDANLKIRNEERYARSVMLKWNRDLEDGDLAFEELSQDYQDGIVKLQKQVDDGIITRRQQLEYHDAILDKVRAGTVGIAGASKSAPREITSGGPAGVRALSGPDKPGVQKAGTSGDEGRSDRVIESSSGKQSSQTGEVQAPAAQRPNVQRGQAPVGAKLTLKTGGADGQKTNSGGAGRPTGDTDQVAQDPGQALWALIRKQFSQIKLPEYSALTDLEQGGLLIAATDGDSGGKGLRSETALQLVDKYDRPQQLADDSGRTIDGTDLIREIPEMTMLAIESQVDTKLTATQRAKLEQHYDAQIGSEEFATKLREDVVNYVNKGIESVAAAIRHIVKAVVDGVLAVAVVFNPGAFNGDYAFNMPQVVKTSSTQTIEAEVPPGAKERMSPLAQQVYESMAPVARKTGKGFIVADKPMGAIHFFNADGSVLVQDTALYGAGIGDKIGDKIGDVPKVTPAGSYTLRTAKDPEYTGGTILHLVETQDQWGIIAVHPVWLGDPSQNRTGRLNSATVADKRVSYGCINTKEATFLDDVLPVVDHFNGGMIFVLPDSTVDTSEMFPAQTSTTTHEYTEGGAKGSDVRGGALGKNETAAYSKAAPRRADGTKPVVLFLDDQGLGRSRGSAYNESVSASLDRINAEDHELFVDEFPDLEGVVQIGNISLQHGHLPIKGRGSDVMRAITEYADANNETLFLAAKASGRLKQDDLVSWYERNGFEPYARGVGMIRYPKPVAQKSKVPGKASSQAAQVLADIKGLLRLDALSSKVTVVQSASDLPAGVKQSVNVDDKTQGFVYKGKAYLVADNIAPGKARAVFLHEVGAHLGLENLLGAAQYKALVGQIKKWAARNDGSQESTIAKAAQQRVTDAKTTADQSDNELLAYFIEEAVDAGVDPTAANASTEFGRWFRNLWAAFKRALHTLGINPDKLTARDVVDMAYGAAKLESTGAWHGAAAQFRKFDHKYMGTGEGAQAFGWGSYFAQSPGIAKGYFTTDVRNKTRAGVSPEGALYRIDFNIQDDEWLDLDKPLSEQSEKVTASVLNGLSAEGWNEAKFRRGAAQYTGREVYDYISDQLGSDKDASEFLDSIGVKGNRFLDANSRPKPATYTVSLLEHTYSKFDELNPWLAFRDSGVTLSKQFPTKEAADEWVSADRKKNTPPDPTSNFVVFNDKNIQRVASLKGADREKTQFSKATVTPVQSGNKVVDALPGAISRAWDGLKHLTSKGALNLMLTDDLIEQATKVVPAAAQYMKAMSEINVAKTRQEQQVADILTMFKALPAHEQGTKGVSVNALIKASTMAQKWAFKPDWLKAGEHTDIDPALKEWFDKKLSAKGREVVTAVFRHGHESLLEMQKAATESANSEFDVLIKDADTRGDTAESARLTQLKQKELTEFQTLFSQRSAWPYAPLRRFGGHVVMGMSARYLDARGRNDVKEMRELEQNGDHYYVSFAETKAQANKDLAKIKDSFPGGETGTFEKLDQADSMLGGRDMLSALRRFRNMALEEGDGKTDARVRDLTRQLYLMLLAEGSARKGELNRRNIAGADEDMMRSFASNGRATAHFIASLKTGGKVDDALQEMRSQVRRTLDGREKRQMYFNEIMRRHSMSLTYQSNSLVDSTLAMTSGYMLLSNPSYFLINATQPWMMSLPMMVGKHSMVRAAPALLKAYQGMAAVLKDGKLDGSDYAMLPNDVRDMVKKLADTGVISIELSHDMGSFRSNPDSKTGDLLAKATNWVRGAAQSVETLNRLTTAIAALRLEKARGATDEQAVDYASKLITNTHGNYTGFNAPRFMRTDLGRVATQFRKFQLVQLTMFAKLLQQSFKGANAAEKAIARKALAFNLGTLAATGGLTAMPGFMMASWLLGKVFGDEDEPDDLRAKITREYGKPMADLLWGGLSQKAGVPLGGRLGAGGMLSLLPYTDIEMSRDGYAAVAIGLAGPTIGGVLPRVWDGVGMAAKGDVWKGMEQMAPSGLSNLSKSLRFQAQGLTQRNGDVVLSNDEIGLLDTVLQGVGLTPNTVADRNWLAGAKFDADTFYSERTSALKRQYANAVHDNDADGMREAREAWTATQAARREVGYKVQPLSELLKAPQERRKREAAVTGGVQHGKDNAAFVSRLTQ